MIKRQFLRACCVVMMLSGCVLADFGGGSGTADDPYLIYTREHLLDPLIVEGAAGELHVKLMEDIDFEGEPFPTLRNHYRFCGVFDGNHKSIKNIYMENQYGFIRLASGCSTVLKNLTLENPILVITQDGLRTGILAETFHRTTTVENCHIVNGIIEGPLTARNTAAGIQGVDVGGFAMRHEGTIRDCSFSGSAAGYRVGGLVAFTGQGSLVQNCHAAVEVYAGVYAGGLVCRNWGHIRGCSTSGTVVSDGTDWAETGGLVGHNHGDRKYGYYDGNGKGDGDGQIVDCHSSCDVVGNGKGIGGLVGISWSGAICRCYATGEVSGYSYLGGLIGTMQTMTVYAYKGVIENSYSAGGVSGHDRIGGFAGECASSIIRNCYNWGSASGTDIVGGLVGCVYVYGYDGKGPAEVDKCYSVGKVTGSQRTGGLIGREWNGTQVVTNSFWDTETSGWNYSAKGSGRNTSQMKALSTFANAGWDFVGETANGQENIWLMEDANYPILSWQFVNTAPVADAGCDEMAYAEPNGFAHVVLDANDSYDVDGDELSYMWAWEIGGEIFETNGVGPVVCLPVGEHSIELVVNDGTEDSEPNYVVVTVIEPLQACVRVAPRFLNRRAKGAKRLLALVRLSKGVCREDVDEERRVVLNPGGTEAEMQLVLERKRGRLKGTWILAVFDRKEVLGQIAGRGFVEVEVVGCLKTGEWFSGSDVLRVR